MMIFDEQDKEGRKIYIGGWKDDKFEGYGVMEHRDGFMYQGYWKDGKMDGYGTERGHSNSTYTGMFSQGMKHGNGDYRDSLGF